KLNSVEFGSPSLEKGVDFWYTGFMNAYFFYFWGLSGIVGLFFIFFLVRNLLRRPISQRALKFSIVICVVLMLVRIAVGAVLIHRAWSQSDGVERYWTLEYTNKIYTDTLNVLEKFGVDILIGIAIFSLLRAVQKKREYIFERDDVLMVAFGSMISGWPNFFIFLALVFAFTVVIKIIRVTFRKERLGDRLVITPAIPLAVITMLIWGGVLTSVTGLYGIR
ncbi:MAG: hypothetical protein V1685_07500, partial [Parcubacteria group bacterium]